MGFLTSTAGILLMIFGFGVLIFVHELGHFLAAKWAGIRTEGFAVGMGPVMLSWRKGIGLCAGSTHAKVVAKTGKASHELTDAELERHGLGETEYSLRCLPIGGFVKMLGQEDLNPAAVSRDPRSYNVCPVGKRMVVVSAGVVMNVILALVFFMWAFLVGVQFDAPVVGTVLASSPAERAVAKNAAALGITTPGLQPADRVLTIDDGECRTYADIRIAAAMGRPGVPLEMTVERPGVSAPLEFNVVPELDPLTGMLEIGVGPGATNRLLGESAGEGLHELLEEVGLARQNVKPGMRLVEAAGTAVTTFEQFGLRVAEHGGPAIMTRWRADGDGAGAGESGAPAFVDAEVRVRPVFQVLRYPDDGRRNYERGLFGLVPLTRVAAVLPGSPNAALLREDDLLLRVGALAAPRLRDLITELGAHSGETIDVTVLRDGREVSFEARVSREGRLGFATAYAWDAPFVAQAMDRVVVPTETGVSDPAPTPAAAIGVPPGAAIVSVGGRPIADWEDVRAALRAETDEAARVGAAATVTLSLRAPDAAAAETVEIALSPADVADLHALSWSSELPAEMFEPLYTNLTADGNPLLALRMGFVETHKMITMTYLTIDRLFRGTVGVEQLRGPVGIIDLGTKVMPRGFMFFLFFLGMISVNLAVLNFLPLPIVDGGLFLFLVYEKIRGTPPSVRFQNAAAIVGLCLIGAVFVVTFYNDIMRLVST